jgi:hypothetical protein
MQFRRSRSARERVLNSIREQVRDRPGATAAAAVGVVAAAAAGVAAVRSALGNGHDVSLHVQADDEAGWLVSREGLDRPLDRFERKREAVKAAQELARRRRPSSLTIHRSDGNVSRTYVYEAG